MSDALKVLLVDDDALDRTQLRRLAARAPEQALQVVEAATLMEARRALFSQAFACVLLDMNLPDGTGLELLPELRGVPVVMLTGLDDDLMASQALQEGAQDYLVKGSFDERMLLRAVQYAMQRCQHQAQSVTLERLAHQVSLGRLAASVAHQINNPNTFIHGNLSLLQASFGRWELFVDRLRRQARSNSQLASLLRDFPELVEVGDLPEMILDAQAGAARVTDIVQQLQTLRSMEVEQEHSRVNLKDCLVDVLELARSRSDALLLEERLLQGELWVMGHAGRLQSLLGFLLSNARARSRGAQDRLWLELERSKGRAVFSLLHEGDFEPLQMYNYLSLTQLDLGMAICNTIVNEHAGVLLFDDAPQQIIRLELPGVA